MNTNHAKQAVVDWLQTTDYKYVGFGTDSTAATLADTALGSELSAGSYARLVATQGENSTDEYELTGTWTNESGSAETIEEIGIFDAASAGNMLHRFTTTDTDFASVTVPNGDTLTVALRIPVNDSSE